MVVTMNNAESTATGPKDWPAETITPAVNSDRAPALFP
jgi:hypothetical protein